MVYLEFTSVSLLAISSPSCGTLASVLNALLVLTSKLSESYKAADATLSVRPG